MHDTFKNDILAPWPMNQVELQRKEYATQVALDERQLSSLRSRAEMEEVMDHARHQLLMTMRHHIYGKNHAPVHVIRYPKTWWDAVKERFAPAWFRDRYPIEFVTITSTLEELYPDFVPSLPGHVPTIRVYTRSCVETPYW